MRVNLSPNRWLIAISAIVLALILLSIVIALIRPATDSVVLPADAPEGVVQRYIQALQAPDFALARSYYSTRLQGTCTVDEITEQTRWIRNEESSRRIELVETTMMSDGRTQVRARVTDVTVSPPFGVNEYSHDEWYILVREGGGWRLDAPGWPVTYCRGFNEALPHRP
jgi:hypothetical protein